MRRPTGAHHALRLFVIAGAALLVGYGIGRTQRHDQPTIDQRISRAYGHDVGHCRIDADLTHAIREAGGGQTAYLCGASRYSAIINADGWVFPGGTPSSQK
jgi:hypothetical protein